ncbi:MAG: GntR family transcriptional regulator [Burkholderiaceae bacterium]
MSETPTKPAPIQRRTLHGEVVGLMRDMIVAGDLAAGERINEVELGARLGVSRTPLREAIRTLASEGLVELVPSRGATVRRFTLADVTDMLEAIDILERNAARLACERATDDEIAEIARMHAEMMACYRSRNRMAYYKLNQAIHAAIVRLSHNGTLSELHELLQSRLKRIRYIGNGEPAKWAGAVAEHEQMMAALSRRDGNTLAEAVGAHLRATRERVADSL